MSAITWSAATTTAASCPARCSSASPGAAARTRRWSRSRSPSSTGSARPPGETVNLGVAAGNAVEQIAQVDCTYLIGGTNWIGRPVPLHASGLGKVLLAYGAAKLPTGELERCTDKTITSEAALRADLAAVRARGYAVTDEELERGLIAFAAPVFRYDGTVVAALSVSAPTTRMNRETAANAARHCVDEAAGLSSALGHRPRTSRKG